MIIISKTLSINLKKSSTQSRKIAVSYNRNLRSIRDHHRQDLRITNVNLNYRSKCISYNLLKDRDLNQVLVRIQNLNQVPVVQIKNQDQNLIKRVKRRTRKVKRIKRKKTRIKKAKKNSTIRRSLRVLGLSQEVKMLNHVQNLLAKWFNL